MRRLKGSSLHDTAVKNRRERVANIAWALFWEPTAVGARDAKLLRRCGLAEMVDGVCKLTKAASQQIYLCYLERFAPK